MGIESTLWSRIWAPVRPPRGDRDQSILATAWPAAAADNMKEFIVTTTDVTDAFPGYSFNPPSGKWLMEYIKRASAGRTHTHTRNDMHAIVQYVMAWGWWLAASSKDDSLCRVYLSATISRIKLVCATWHWDTVGATPWRRGRDGVVGWGLRGRAEWPEPRSMMDSNWPRCVAEMRALDIGELMEWTEKEWRVCIYTVQSVNERIVSLVYPNIAWLVYRSA